MSDLTEFERMTLEAMDTNWLQAKEIWWDLIQIHRYKQCPTQKQMAPILRGLRSKGLVGYRPPDGIAGLGPVGMWAITEEGDKAIGRT